MKNGEFKTFLIILSGIVVCLGLFFSFSVNVKLYKESHINALSEGYKLAGEQGANQIEYALRYGKNIAYFYNMNGILRQIMDSAPETDNVEIIDRNGRTLYSLYQSSDLNADEVMEAATGKGTPYIDAGSFYYIPVPIIGADNNTDALMVIRVKSHVLNEEVSAFEREYGMQLLMFAAGGLILIIICIARIKLNTKRKLVVYSVILGVMTLIILGVFNGYSLYMTEDSLRFSIDKIGNRLCSIAQMDINRVLGKGVTIDRIHDISGWLEKISSGVPQIRNLYINEQNEVQALMSQSYIQERARKIAGNAVYIITGCVFLQVLITTGLVSINNKLSTKIADQDREGEIL